MFNLIKLIIFFFSCSYLYRLNKNSYLISVKQNKINHKNDNIKNCKHSYEYSKLEKLPTKDEDGIKCYICKYCKKKYFESIPKLNKKNYK